MKAEKAESNWRGPLRGMNSLHMQRHIEEGLPEYVHAVADLHRELGAYCALVHPSAHRAVGLLLTQTTNDFIDMLEDVGMGRGHPAVRGLRSIFEALVTMLDIASGGNDVADRYAEHHAVVMYRASTMRAGLTGLEGNSLRSERHRRRKEQRTHRQAHDDAIAKWGSGFKRNWTDESLKDRSSRHGYADDYQLYSVLSSTIHVSAGGARGIVRDHDGTNVYRIGPDLLNCPLALNEGLRYFTLFLDSLADHTGIAAERVGGKLRALGPLTGVYRKIIKDIDSAMWPSDDEIAVLELIVMRALLPDGRRKWFLHDNQQARIIECLCPEDASDIQLERTEAMLDEVEKVSHDREEWITVALFGASSEPLSNANWRSDGLLVPLDWNPSGIVLPYDQ